ncbi:MAG: pyridoxamine kinase [Clostridia bacterium]|nr:pyridoxamine kinase [Clostridia bacterium]
MNQQKRILAINDISCFGKCSLAAAVPILSASGIETCMLPTAVLSAHTAFPGFTFRDLTEDMPSEANHWQEMGLSFDGIYSGYLGSIRQVAYVEQIVDTFPCDFVLVDPVMGDNGKLYTGFDEAFAKELRRLLTRADVIVPNVTEASFLAGIGYEADTHSTDYIATVLHALSQYTKGDVVLTGVHTGKDTLGTAVFQDGMLHVIERPKYDVVYSGTGDVFASAFAGAVMNGKDVLNSAELASDFVIDCIEATVKTSGNRNYGVNFELCIGKLIERLQK